MLSQEAAVELNRDLADTRVLSVYLNGEETDPARRNAWRVRLSGMLKELSEGVADEGAALQAAESHILEELARFEGLLPGRGWVGFATADGLRYAGASAAAMPNQVRWEDGAHVTPYLRAMKQSRPVTAVLADRRQARVFRYLHGELEEEATYEADGGREDGRPGRPTGGRESRNEALKKSEEAAAQRLIRQVSDILSQAVEDGHLIVLGGSMDVTAALRNALPDRSHDRVHEVSSLHMDESPSALKEVVDRSASELSMRLQQKLVDEVIETTRADGRACLGPERTQRALAAGAVDTLVLSRSFTRANPDLAEQLVDQTFDQGGAVEEIHESITALDEEGGVGARLRFTS